MAPQLIDGKMSAQQVRDEVASHVAKRVVAGKPNRPWQGSRLATGWTWLYMSQPNKKSASRKTWKTNIRWKDELGE